MFFNLSSTPTCLLVLMHVFSACSPKLSLSSICTPKSFSTLVCSISVPLTSTLMLGVSFKVPFKAALWYLLLKFCSYHLSVLFAALLRCACTCLLDPKYIIGDRQQRLSTDTSRWRKTCHFEIFFTAKCTNRTGNLNSGCMDTEISLRANLVGCSLFWQHTP